MTHKTLQEQAPARAEQPAVPTGTAQPSQSDSGKKEAIVELTSADLQAVNGGGSKPGIASGSNEH